MTRRAVACMLLASPLAACGGGPVTSAVAAPALSGSLTVLAAASLALTFEAATPALRSAHPGLSLTYAFAGSQQLVQNVIDGAPADVVATADTTTMGRLVAAGLVSAPQVFARNALEIAVTPGNPRRVTSLASLASPGLDVVLADPSVPAGEYAAQALRAAGVQVTPRSLELSVTAALEKVEAGDADAAIVYTTDVAATGGRVTGVPIPPADNVTATYVVAAVLASPAHDAARAYIADVLHGRIHLGLLQAGFLPP